jgi:hypothetical protein
MHTSCSHYLTVIGTLSTGVPTARWKRLRIFPPWASGIASLENYPRAEVERDEGRGSVVTCLFGEDYELRGGT